MTHFVLILNQFLLQLRLDYYDLNNPASGIISKAICAKIDIHNTLQFEINTGNRITLLLNNEKLEISDDVEVLDLESVLVHCGVDGYTIHFSNGIRLDVSFTHLKDAFFVVATVPNPFTEATSGILRFIGNKETDGFNSRKLTSNDRDIFVDGCRVDDSNSLFFYLKICPST